MSKPFRETLWFKLGDVRTDEGEDAAVPLPIEDRYCEDASADDTAQFGLHAGTTQAVRAMSTVELPDVPMKTLVREMRATRKALAIGASACAALAAFAMYLA